MFPFLSQDKPVISWLVPVGHTESWGLPGFVSKLSFKQQPLIHQEAVFVIELWQWTGATWWLPFGSHQLSPSQHAV